MPQPDERFFYHSFPRRRAEDDTEYSKALRVLKSIVKSGLLLTPEKYEIREFLKDGKQSEPVVSYQKRVCFTELSPGELPSHCETFGPFSLEFTIENLRRLGAVPVFYFPSASAEEFGLEGIGVALMARLAEVQCVLSRLEKLEELTGPQSNGAELLNITRDGNEVGTTGCTVGAARDLVSFLRLQTQPISQLLASVRALSNFFYPTEDIEYNDSLSYYRQREWRIIGNMVHRGKPIDRELTEQEMTSLQDIDGDFFGRTMSFPSGEHRIVERCKYFSELESAPIWTLARRVVVPDEAFQSAETMLKGLDCLLPLVRLSDLLQ